MGNKINGVQDLEILPDNFKSKFNKKLNLI